MDAFVPVISASFIFRARIDSLLYQFSLFVLFSGMNRSPKIKTETMAVPVLRFILQILAAFHEVACWRC